MHTDTPQNKKPTGSANYPAGHTDSQILKTKPDPDKSFSALAAHYALAGHTFTRCISPDGSVRYYVGRWGMARVLPDLQTAAAFLARIGGST